MQNILLIGAGRSTASLIDYIVKNAKENEWKLKIVDQSVDHLGKWLSHETVTAQKFDVNDSSMRQELIRQADIVISMLPAHMHLEVAKDCITFKKNIYNKFTITSPKRFNSNDFFISQKPMELNKII
mgnify:CR=1 FL=1